MFVYCYCSVFIILAIGFALLTSETLSVGLTLSTSFPYIYINSVESGLLLPHAAAAHTGLFAALTLVLVVAAVTSAFPTRRPLSRLFFAVLFSACASRALLGWGFRDTLEEDKMDWLSRPSIYCFFSTLFSTFAALNGSLPRSSYAAVVVFLCAAFIPITTVLFIWFTVGLDTLNDYINGIVWVAAVLHAGIGISVRAIELMRDVEAMQSLKTSIDSSGHGGGVLSRENPVAGRICLATAGLCMMWTLVASLGISSSVGSVLGPDLLIPLSSLVLLCTRKGGIIPDKHPLVVSALIASICWLSSAIYSIFILRDDTNYDPFKDGAFNIFKDGTVSIWTSQSMFMPGLHICLCLSPLPALLLSFIRVPGINEVSPIIFITFIYL